MGKTIRRSYEDSDVLVYILRDKLPGEDNSRPVQLTDKEVRFTMVDSNIDTPKVFDGCTFESIADRDAYFASNPTLLIDGLVIDVTYILNEILYHKYYRWRDSKWNEDFWVVVNDKICRILDAGKGYTGYAFTTEEGRRPGMFHATFRVITNPGDPLNAESAKYPRGDSLWIHIMDVFTE